MTCLYRGGAGRGGLEDKIRPFWNGLFQNKSYLGVSVISYTKSINLGRSQVGIMFHFYFWINNGGDPRTPKVILISGSTFRIMVLMQDTMPFWREASRRNGSIKAVIVTAVHCRNNCWHREFSFQRRCGGKGTGLLNVCSERPLEAAGKESGPRKATYSYNATCQFRGHAAINWTIPNMWHIGL
jgi:hypothetical protein